MLCILPKFRAFMNFWVSDDPFSRIRDAAVKNLFGIQDMLKKFRSRDWYPLYPHPLMGLKLFSCKISVLNRSPANDRGS